VLVDTAEAVQRIPLEEDDERVDTSSLEFVHLQPWTPLLPENHQVDLHRAICLGLGQAVTENWEPRL